MNGLLKHSFTKKSNEYQIFMICFSLSDGLNENISANIQIRLNKNKLFFVKTCGAYFFCIRVVGLVRKMATQEQAQIIILLNRDQSYPASYINLIISIKMSFFILGKTIKTHNGLKMKEFKMLLCCSNLNPRPSGSYLS